MGIFQGYLMVSDMDGTLLNSNGQISEKNIEGINEFIKEGGAFTIATGRMREGVRRFLQGFPINVPVIMYNGGYIYDFNKEEALVDLFLEEDAKGYLERVRAIIPSVGIEIYANEQVYVFNDHVRSERFAKKGYDVFFQVPEDVFHGNWKKVLFVGDKEDLDLLQERFHGEIGPCNIVRSDKNFLEMIPMGLSKGAAVKNLCNLLGYDINKVIAVGDNMNDLEMLSVAGYGFAVENSEEKVKEVVKLRCKSNDDDAIFDVVNQLRTML